MQTAIRGSDVVLRDGSILHVRDADASDEGVLLALLRGLSHRSRTFRFFSASTEPAETAHALVSAARARSMLAFDGAGACVAHGCYVSEGDERAEVAFAVADEYQGRGVGTILLGLLAEKAHAEGIHVFHAWVMSDNAEMLAVFRESGLPTTSRQDEGGLTVEMPTSLSASALLRFDLRDQIATIASLGPLLAPSSVAVIGASRERGEIGGELFHNLIAREFNGPVYPVNPNAAVVQSVRAYRSVGDIPAPVDLAIVVVPARAVLGVARECAAVGVRALVVISAGFGETGDAGRDAQRQLVALCRASGMRLVGPNCMGIVNTAPGVRMNGTFAPSYPAAGRVAFMSQSGALGLAVIDESRGRGLGLSTFVSVGNKADVSANDLLQYWDKDPATDVVLLYLESFGNPRRFSRISRRVARTKPIVAVKSGRGVAGARATSSHTGALVAASDVTVDALFAQAGVIRTTTLEEMFDVAQLLASQPIPAGRRVAILTNAGGPAILCADACEAAGLEVTPLPEETRRELAAFLPPEASTVNPVDMIASASAENYARALAVLGSCDAIDAVIAIYIPPLAARRAEVALAVARAAAALRRRVPVLAVYMTAEPSGDPLVRAVPAYRYPEDAAVALGHAARHGAWRAEPEGRAPDFPDARRREAARLIADARSRGGGWLAPHEVHALFGCYGLPLARQTLVADAEEVERAALAIGGRVALKAVAPGLVHKTEAGAVALDLDATTIRAALADMRHAPALRARADVRFVVQEMAPKGVEMLVGVVHDPLFGPVVACGAGGTTVELIRDVAVRLTPLTDRDAHTMVRSLRTYPLLAGYRGAPAADVDALEDVLLRVAAMVDAHAEIVELDANPVIVHQHGAVIVDARVRIAEPAHASPLIATLP